jgi:hypothetical protein
MRSTDFKAVVEPILNDVFDGIYDQRADEWKMIFKERTGIARAYHEEPVLFGFGAAPELPDGMPVTYVTGGTLYMARYVYKVYGLAFAVTKVLVEDGDHISIAKTFSEHLAQSLIETQETLAANVINRAFNSSYVGGDGVSLVNPSHPIANGLTYSNQISVNANLSQSSLEQILIDIRKAIDYTGRKIRVTPKALVLPPDLIMQGEVLLKSVLRTGQANNDINPVKSLGLLSEGQKNITRLTSSKSWFVQTDAPRGLQMMMRRSLQKSMEGDFETDSMRYKATMRYIPGWTDGKGLYGAAGV